MLAETRGEIISGFIASKTDADLSNKYITLSIPGTNFIYKVTKTDKQGHFNFIIDQGSKSSDVVLQLINEENKNFVIKLNKTVRPDLSNLTISKSLNLSEHLRDEIELRSIANQIENNYYYKKEDSTKVNSITNPFYYGTEKEYILENYTRFPTLKETIIEYVTDLNMKSNNGNIEFYLSLANSQHEPVKQREPCLLLVDGLQIQNSKDLFNYDIKGIEKIAVVPNSYYLGPKLFNGVVSITTINQDFPAIYSGNESTKKSILRPSEPKKYFAQTYAGITKNSKVPDYRYQLLWEPNLTTQNIQQVISFYSSDITGNFEIVLEGLSEEGKVVRITKTLLIK